MSNQNNRPEDDEKDLPLEERDPATLTSEEIWELTSEESDDDQDAFAALTADELVEMFTMIRGMASTKN